MFNAETTIINRIKAKNKSLVMGLKVLETKLEGKCEVIFIRKDSTSGKLQHIRYKYDSFYQLTHIENWLETNFQL